MENKSLAQVRELFQDDRFATLNGTQITEIGAPPAPPAPPPAPRPRPWGLSWSMRP